MSGAAQAGEGELIAQLHAGWLRRVVVPLACLLMALVGYVVAIGAGERDAAVYAAAMPSALGLVVAAVFWARKVVIRRDSLLVRGLFHSRTVRFAELEGFTYDLRRYRFYLFLPLGRVAELRLWGGGQRASFHGGIARFDVYAPIVVDLCVAAMVKRLREAIDRGEPARFGRRLEVDHETLHAKGLLSGEVRAGLDQLRIEVVEGEFRISTPEKELGRYSIASTPNLLALPQLVEELSVTRGRPRPATLAAALREPGPPRP